MAFAALDLFSLFVEHTFGSILLAGFGILALIAFICMISKMSPISMTWIIILFVIAYGAGYVGAVVAVPAFLITFIYFVSSLWQFISSYR